MSQNKLSKFIFSTRLMSVLFVLFAAAMAVGTFIENSHSTAFARKYVYNAKWFELIMVLLAINFIGNIYKYELWRRGKWATLLFHLSFILVIVGAGVSRYISFEGILPMENGTTANSFYSQKTFISTLIDGEVDGKMMRKTKDFHVLFAGGANNKTTLTTDFKGQKVEFKVDKFIYGAKSTVVPDPDGGRFLKLVTAGSGERQDIFIPEGQVINVDNILLAFNKETEGALNFTEDEDGNLSIESPFPGEYTVMATQESGEVTTDSTQAFHLRSLYNFGGLQFVVPEASMTGHYEIVHDKTQEKNGLDAVFLTVKSKGEEQKVQLMGTSGSLSNYTDIHVGGLDIHLRYGSKEYKLPFTIHLDQFIAKKYPGTADNPTPSYSSYLSKVTVEDEGKTTKHDIYMNHVLDHKGYRFFQSSFLPGERGTVLSVNHDWWGTNITYLGYGLLYLGLILILFIKGSRFKDLEAKLRRIKKSKNKKRSKLAGVIAILLLMGSFSAHSQVRKEDVPGYEQSTTQHDSIPGEKVDTRAQALMGLDFSNDQVIATIKANIVPKEEAAKFGKLVIQDYQGRMKPVNTYSSELLRKLSRQDTYEGLTSDQVLLSMSQNPYFWYNVPIIKIKKNDDSIRHVLGVPKDQKLIKFIQFFEKDGTYKFAPYLEDAYRAKVKSQFQKDLTDTDGQVNLLYSALKGDLLRIFPVPNDQDNKWISYPELDDYKYSYHGKDSLFVSNALPIYLRSLYDGTKEGDYTQADQMLEGMHAFQKKFGGDIMPSEKRIQAEVLYNKYDVFKNMFKWYLYAGLFLFIFVILEIFYPRHWIQYIIEAGRWIVILLFILHTAALITRWYVSGHAPWSDAYESMIYVAWATVLFGLIFGRKSDLTLASTAFVAAIILMVSHWNWMDPAIANLEPVLDSYWIMIHTSVIVASYGPFTLGMILGIIALLLMIFTNKGNKDRMKINIKEVTIITEMALTVGIVLLTIGNFLGGQWANESWGRYWSWDPKETWCLISIMVYAFVVHMRLVPGLNNRFSFNWITVLAYGSILMTYFGVNFYLAGLHSYASGDQIISFKFIGIALAIWAILGLLAYRKYRVFYKGGGKELKAENQE